MLSLKKLKDIVNKENKKISKKAIKKINLLLEEKARETIKKSARNADFEGRKVIKEKDIETTS